MTVSQLTFQNTFDTESSTNPTFTLDYQFFNNSELRVILDGTVLTEGTAQDQYTPSGANSGSVGSVQLNGSYSAGTANLIITRVIPLTQATDLQANSTFDAEAQEDQFDKLTAIAQQSLGIDTTRGENYDAGSRKITNVANGQNPKDAVNYEQLSGAVFDVAPVQSVNGESGAVVLDTGDIAEGSNLYHTNARASAAAPIQTVTGTNITVTTDGSGNVNITGPTGSESGGSVPTVSSADNGKMVDVAGGVYRVSNSGTIRSTLGLATTDDVTFRDVNVGVDLDVAGASQLDGNLVVGSNKFTVTASSGDCAIVGVLGVAGDATFAGDVTVTDDLQIQNDGHIKAQSGGVGVNIDCTNSKGSLHVQETSSVTNPSSGPSNTVLLAQSDTADHTGLCIMGPARNSGDDHDIKFSVRNETAMTTGIRSTRAASQASDSMGLFVNGQKVIDIQDAAVDFGGSTGGDTRLKNVENGVSSKDAVNLSQITSLAAEEMNLTFGYNGDGQSKVTCDYGSDTNPAGGQQNYENHAVGLKIGDSTAPLPSWCSNVNTTDHSITLKSGTYHIHWQLVNYIKALAQNGVRSGKLACGLASGTVNNQSTGSGDPSNALTDMLGNKKTPTPFVISEAQSLANITDHQVNYTQSFTLGTYGDGATHNVYPFAMYGFSGTSELADGQYMLGSAHIRREELTG
jgi:hypothetical protein